MSFIDMGYSMDQIDMLAKVQRIGSGLIVFMGETGSAKTTALKTLIETHPRNGRVAFYEIADPVEYYMKGVHQVPIQRDLMDTKGSNDPYAEVVSSLMRMDPSVISIGEMRDRITAQGGNYVATSGHVAMATMHSDGMIGAVARFSDPTLGLTRQTITGGKMLGFMGYQALAPKLCKCAIDFSDAVTYEKDHQNYVESDYLGTLANSLRKKYDIDAQKLRFKNPVGCHLCGGRGTKGLTMLAEMMLPDDQWLDLAAQGKDREAMKNWRQTYSDKRVDSPAMNGKLVIEHAIHKSLIGVIDPRNIEKHGVLDMLEVLA
jgi:type II secretory ATPase GspE/PulE/Tfp pilus assembly ATPase PilB-like protein